MVPALVRVRALIASAAAGPESPEAVQLGTISLYPHQRAALTRVRAAITEFGGALLADEPGLGKTFVALATAAEYAGVLVIGPASLRGTWQHAAVSAERRIEFVSFEMLSRREAVARPPFVVIDEAHHLGNPGTARYARTARSCRNAHVLLLSATPVRNRPAELDALLALFLGARAATLPDADRERCIIRRAQHGEDAPVIDGPRWHRVPSAAWVVRAIRALPPPLPLDDGGSAHTLVMRTLVRCWASSAAALDASLRRRVQRGAAVRAILEAGRLPSRRELRAWVVADDSVQLAFPLLASGVPSDATGMLAILNAHTAAVDTLRARLAPIIPSDTEARASFLRDLRRTWPRARILAFTTYAATAAAIFRALRHEPGVAILTARGARSAGGERPREDVITAFSGTRHHPSPSDDITMVIATDLLSEGVNLQGASIVVHLDVPWTPAGLDQRVGRAARIGSTHRVVRVHGLAPSRDAQLFLGLKALLARKRADAGRATAPARAQERLLRLLTSWRDTGLALESRADAHASGRPREHPISRRTPVACVHASQLSAIAAVLVRGNPRVIAATPRVDRRGWELSTSAADVADCVAAASKRPAAVPATLVRQVRGSVNRWLQLQDARTESGVHAVASDALRAFFSRMHGWLLHAAPHMRAGLAARAEALRRRVSELPNAGAEASLREIAARPASRAEEWFALAESELAEAAAVTAPSPTRAHESRIVALLVLSPASRPLTAQARQAARTSASW